jgi:hypothetical protein
MSELDDAFRAAESLDPDDRMRLIARLWATLPKDYFDKSVSREPGPSAPVSQWPASWDPVRVEVKPRLSDMQSLAGLATDFARNLFRPPATPLKEKIYSAPRRFDLATIFVVTVAYSLLFGVMNYVVDYLSYPRVTGLFVGAFITFVAVGQALLYGGQNARVASVVTGIALCVLWNMIAVVWPPRGVPGIGLLFLIPFSGALGAGCGYVAGVLVGGVFLVADKLRTYYATRMKGSASEQVEPMEVGPDNETHVTT